MTWGEAGRRAGIARTRGVVTGANFCYRDSPPAQEMALRIRRGDAGAVRTDGSEERRPLPRPTFDTGAEEMRIRDAMLSSRRAGSWAKVG